MPNIRGLINSHHRQHNSSSLLSKTEPVSLRRQIKHLTPLDPLVSFSEHQDQDDQREDIEYAKSNRCVDAGSVSGSVLTSEDQAANDAPYCSTCNEKTAAHSAVGSAKRVGLVERKHRRNIVVYAHRQEEDPEVPHII